MPNSYISYSMLNKLLQKGQIKKLKSFKTFMPKKRGQTNHFDKGKTRDVETEMN